MVLMLISEVSAQSEEWGDSYRTYTINVSIVDSVDVSLSYEVRFYKDTTVGKFQTNSLDTFLMLLFEDLGKLPPIKSDVLFYFHGMFGGQAANYNYTLLDFNERYLERDNSSICRIIGYRWPAQNPIYVIDKSNAHKIAEVLSDNFNQIVTAINGLEKSKVNALANSLGNELFKEMMRYELQRQSQKIQLHQVVFSAPDLIDTALESDSVLHQALDYCDGLTVYYSQKDLTLGLSKNFNNQNRLGLSGPSEATLGHSKLSFVEVTEISDEKNLAWKMTGHSYVRASDKISRDILAALMGIPPDRIKYRKVLDQERQVYKLLP